MGFLPVVLVQSEPQSVGVGQNDATEAGSNHKESHRQHHQKDCVQEHEQRKARIVKEDDERLFDGLFQVVVHKGTNRQHPLKGKSTNQEKPKHQGCKEKSYHAFHLQVEGNGYSSQHGKETSNKAKNEPILPNQGKILKPFLEGNGLKVCYFCCTGAKGKDCYKGTTPKECQHQNGC